MLRQRLLETRVEEAAHAVQCVSSTNNLVYFFNLITAIKRIALTYVLGMTALCLMTLSLSVHNEFINHLKQLDCLSERKGI